MPFLLKVTYPMSNRNLLAAAEAVQQGELIAYPTEAVFGLGCDPFNEEACKKLLILKERSVEQGLILVASQWSQVFALTDELPPSVLSQLQSVWPGPITFLLPPSPRVPPWIIGQHPLVAIRLSHHPIIIQLCDALGHTLVSTSANRHGEPPIRDFETLSRTFSGQAILIDAPLGTQNQPSPILNALTGEQLR